MLWLTILSYRMASSFLWLNVFFTCRFSWVQYDCHIRTCWSQALLCKRTNFSVNITFYSSKACYMKSCCNLFVSFSVWLFGLIFRFSLWKRTSHYKHFKNFLIYAQWFLLTLHIILKHVHLSDRMVDTPLLCSSNSVFLNVYYYEYTNSYDFLLHLLIAIATNQWPYQSLDQWSIYCHN